MAVKYLAGNRLWGTDAERLALSPFAWTQLVGTSTSDTFYVLEDTGNDLIDVKASGNCGTDASPSIAYATLGSTLSSSAWLMRFKLVFNTVTAESTGGKSFFTNFFLVDNGAVWDSSENGFGFRFIADAGSTQTQFYSMTSGTASGSSMSYTPATSNTLYVQISYSSGTATANFYTNSGFSTGTGTANVTRSGTFSGIKYPQIGLRQDNGGNGVMEYEMSELKIWDGTTSSSGTPTHGGSSILSVHPNLTNGTIYEESDTGKIYMFDGTSAWNEM